MLSKKFKILVTGGAGFIGSHQVDALIEAGHKVIIVDNLSSGQKENLNPKAKFYKVDLRSEELSSIFHNEKPDYVFHFAAQISVNQSLEDPVYDADVNIIGGLNLLENCVDSDVKKVIFASTGGALYGEAEEVPTSENYPSEPMSPYGIAKLTIENYLRFYNQQFGLKYCVMRYANVYGPRQNPKGEAGVISIFITRMLSHQLPVIHGDGHQTRDYIFVGDVVRANMLAFQSEENDTYNVGTGRQTTVNELFDLIKDELEFKQEATHKDVFHGQQVSCLSYEKINKALGWKPENSIEDGIEKTVQWFKNK
ncbi:NAD-dependent epimerase/dehydratase family protein [Candidatus Kuenenbacteria bacterium]|nr:NAD-dependent epimerase/dehydratase family protein [Candidatus Kuenenbacteria bacterium]